MAVNLGDHEYLTLMAEVAWTGVPSDIFWSMAEEKKSFEDAVKARAEAQNQVPLETELFGDPEEALDLYGGSDLDPEPPDEGAFEFYYESDFPFDAIDPEGRLEMAAYQTGIGNQQILDSMREGFTAEEAQARNPGTAGMITPWGIGLSKEEVIQTMGENPGLHAYAGVPLDSWSDLEETADLIYMQGSDAIDEILDATEEAAVNQGTLGRLWDARLSVGNFVGKVFSDTELEFLDPFTEAIFGEPYGELFTTPADVIESVSDIYQRVAGGIGGVLTEEGERRMLETKGQEELIDTLVGTAKDTASYAKDIIIQTLDDIGETQEVRQETQREAYSAFGELGSTAMNEFFDAVSLDPKTGGLFGPIPRTGLEKIIPGEHVPFEFTETKKVWDKYFGAPEELFLDDDGDRAPIIKEAFDKVFEGEPKSNQEIIDDISQHVDDGWATWEDAQGWINDPDWGGTPELYNQINETAQAEEVLEAVEPPPPALPPPPSPEEFRAVEAARPGAPLPGETLRTLREQRRGPSPTVDELMETSPFTTGPTQEGAEYILNTGLRPTTMAKALARSYIMGGMSPMEAWEMVESLDLPADPTQPGGSLMGQLTPEEFDREIETNERRDAAIQRAKQREQTAMLLAEAGVGDIPMAQEDYISGFGGLLGVGQQPVPTVVAPTDTTVTAGDGGTGAGTTTTVAAGDGGTGAVTTDGGDFSAAVAKVTPDDALKETPSYREYFVRLFNAIPGSQRYEAQQMRSEMFSEAESLFYLLRKDWTPFEGMVREPTGTEQADWTLTEEEREKEELLFTRFLANPDTGAGYFDDPQAVRFGSDFYDSVRDLKKRMGEISGISMEDLYDTLRARPMPGRALGDPPFPMPKLTSTQQATKTVMDRFVFMEPDAISTNRLATLVGMYNIHPGADNWLKAKMMKFYRGMMTNWQASGRNSYDFINAFVKDRPAMPEQPGRRRDPQTLDEEEIPPNGPPDISDW